MENSNIDHGPSDGDLDFQLVVDHYEVVDANNWVAGPVHPAVQKILDADRNKIALLTALAKREQDKENAKHKPMPGCDRDLQIEDSHDEKGRQTSN